MLGLCKCFLIFSWLVIPLHLYVSYPLHSGRSVTVFFQFPHSLAGYLKCVRLFHD